MFTNLKIEMIKVISSPYENFTQDLKIKYKNCTYDLQQKNMKRKCI